MANVKFFRLGFDGGVNLATYEAAKAEQDGRIIFAQVKDESEPDGLAQYIWANGIEYKINDVSAFGDLAKRVEALEEYRADLDSSVLPRIDASIDELQEEIEHIKAGSVTSITVDNVNEYITLSAEPSVGDVVLSANIKIADISTSDVEDGLALASDVKQYVAEEIAKMPHFSYEVVEELPPIAEAEEYVIYLVPKDPADPSGNYYDEWMVVMQPSKHFEKIGDTKVDLSDYYTIEEVEGRLADVSNALQEYVDDKVDDLAADVSALQDAVEELADVVEEIGDDVSALHVDVSALQDAVEDLSTKLEEGVVSSVESENEFVNVTPNQGDVKIDVEVIKATDDSSFPSHGLVTDGYVDEKMAWIEIEEGPAPQGNTQGSPEASISDPDSVDTMIPNDLQADSLSVTSTNGDVTIN